MKRRWFRTLPNYYLFFVIMLFLQWNVGKHNILEFMFFMQNLLATPVAGFYGVTWSLTIEEIFYVTFPALLLLLRYITKSPDTRLVVSIVLFILIPFALRLTFFSDSQGTNGDHRQAALMRLDAIAYGVLMAYVKIRLEFVWLFLQKQRAVLLLPFWYFFLFNQFPKLGADDWALIYFPFCSITMALTLPFFDSIKVYNGVVSKPISFLAQISYSLYLCHIPVIIVSNNYFDIKSALSGHLLEFYYIAASILFAYLIHITWEKPMTNLRRKF